MTIKDLPETERPYEKLELYGEKNLSNAELLGIIIKTGTKNSTSIDIARQILKLNDSLDSNDLNFLRFLSIEEMAKINGIGRVKAIQLKAVCELANRMNQPLNYKKIKIKEPNDVVRILMNQMQYEKVEIVKVLLLDTKCNIIKIRDIAIGGKNFVSIGMKEILSESVKIGSPKIILVHNHPSGNSAPSKQDYEVTFKLNQAAKLLGIELLDHIVIGKNEYTSIKSIKNWQDKF